MTLLNRLVQIKICDLVFLVFLLINGYFASAQPGSVSEPVTANAVMDRVAAMDKVRSEAMKGYVSIRTYHLECHCLSHKEADMVVQMSYQAPSSKEFTVLSESGSGAIRDRVFKKLLEAEQESMQQEQQGRSALTPENYKFQLLEYEERENDNFYLLDAQPRSRNKFLFRGKIWVDATDFAITRIEGEPAVNPSWWTERTEFKRRYVKIGKFWLPQTNESETKVRAFGKAVLAIDYGAYQITETPGKMLALSQQNTASSQP